MRDCKNGCKIFAKTRADMDAYERWEEKCEKFIGDMALNTLSLVDAKKRLKELKEEISQILVFDLPECFSKSYQLLELHLCLWRK